MRRNYSAYAAYAVNLTFSLLLFSRNYLLFCYKQTNSFRKSAYLHFTNYTRTSVKRTRKLAHCVLVYNNTLHLHIIIKKSSQQCNYVENNIRCSLVKLIPNVPNHPFNNCKKEIAIQKHMKKYLLFFLYSKFQQIISEAKSEIFYYY